MKIKIGTDELLGLMTNGDLTAMKEKLSGALLAAADSDEMQDAITKRTNLIIEGAFNKAFATLCLTYGGNTMDGWIARVVRQWIYDELENKSVESIIRNVAKDAIKEILPGLVAETVRAIAKEHGGREE